MRQTLSLTLILSLLFPYIFALQPSKAWGLGVNQSSEVLLTQRGRSRGGGRSRSINRGGGGNINRSGLGSSGSGRIKRPQPTNRPITRPNNRPVNRPNTSDRNRIQQKNNINIDSTRRSSNRINRNLINNGNIIVNPRPGRGSWGWHGGSPWYPNYGYWGGGFWGGFAVGAVTTAVTGAIINSNSSSSNTTYVVIEKDSPGYYLFDSYGLTQVQCDTSQSLVFIYGPQDTLMCANPNTTVVAGYYDVDPEDLVLVLRD